MFLSDKNPAFRKLETEFPRHISCASPAGHTYAIRDGRIQEYFCLLLKEQRYGLIPQNGRKFLQFGLGTNARRTFSAPPNLPAPTAFAGLVFHALAVLSWEGERMRRDCASNWAGVFQAGVHCSLCGVRVIR